jgi:hypothetical protein
MSSWRAAAVLIFAGSLAAAELTLLDAVKRRDPKSVESLIRHGADVNAAQPDGATPLAWAVRDGDGRMAEMLLSAGAKVEVANEYGETLPEWRCSSGRPAPEGRRQRQSRALEWRDGPDDRVRRRIGGGRPHAD